MISALMKNLTTDQGASEKNPFGTRRTQIDKAVIGTKSTYLPPTWKVLAAFAVVCAFFSYTKVDFWRFLMP